MDRGEAHRGLVSRRSFLKLAAMACGSLALYACGAGRETSQPSPAVPRETPETGGATPAGPSLRAMIAQMLVVGFRGLTATEADIAPVIRQEGLGGVVLFDFDVPTRSPLRNVQSPQQVRELTEGLQALYRTTLIICADQEGGLVARLNEKHGFPPTVSHQELGERNDPAYTRQQAGQMAATLASVGINLNLAPVVDVNVNPANPVIGSLGRSFSSDPLIVAAQAREFVRAHHKHGVLCTLKHFPGHGSSRQDSHLGFVDVTETWSPDELVPYRELIASGDADVVMTAHVFNARLDPRYPATLSRDIITGLLRQELRFDGVVISDDMQMGAIRQHYSYEGAVELAINAGVDILAIANNSVYEPDIALRAIELIERLVREGRVPEARIRESYARIQRLKSRLSRSPAP